jgi:hypothetical protein
MIRPFYGFWERFRNLDGKPKGKWIIFLYGSKKTAVRMHTMAQKYADTGPVFKTAAEIPKRFKEGRMTP